MLEALFWASSKTNVIATAILGAALVTFSPIIGKLLARKSFKSDGQLEQKNRELITNYTTKIGYAVMILSVTLFIIAGFIVDMR